MDSKQIWEAYNKYLWEKCCKMTFYTRIKRWLWILEAIKPVKKEEWHPVERVVSKKYDEEMKRYNEYEWEKVSKQRFYQRMYRGYPKEEAIKIDFTPRKKKPPKIPKNIRIYPVVLKKKVVVEEDIKIKYQKSEADIIKREYERMIEDMEYQYRISDDPIEAKEINDKIEKLKNEYKTFCLSNY